MKKTFTSLRILLLIATGICAQANAHTDHDKARFVAEKGVDAGDCKNRFRPCASIGYAAQQANKGDTVLVAQGNYELKQFADVLYLVSDVVPALGGFQTLDNYQVQNPQAFPTTLSGVPLEYASQLYDKGFNVIVDSKGQDQDTQMALDKSLAQVNAMYESQIDTPCVNGFAGQFACDKMSLLSHIPVASFPTNSSGANDIWGHVDLNTMKEYALIGLRRGIALVDVSEPVDPVIINAITGQNTTWRDIKVLQYFNRDMNKWEAYVYATADNASEGLTIMNLSDPSQGLVLVDRDVRDSEAHNIYISNVDYGLNIKNSSATPQAHILGANNLGGSMRSYRLTDPEVPEPTYTLSGATRNDYTHDASSMLINDERAQRDCVNATSAGCTVMFDFNESTMRLWDHSNLGSAVELSAVTYPNAEYTHSGWWSEDQQYVILHDELDEQRQGLNTTVHIFEISDLNTPELIATYTGPTRAIDHNGFVRGNKYYMSNYERGVTVLDISDPLQTKQIAYFDTFPSSDNPSFNGVWGVYPYLPSGIILVSDIQGGLYILRDESNTDAKSDASFSASYYEVTEGETVDVVVNRTGTGAMSVDYKILRGAASGNDFTAAESGTLLWDEGDASAKTINIEALDDGTGEATESMYIRLENPSQDAELALPNIAKIDILSLTDRASTIVLSQDSLLVKETVGAIELSVTRSGASDNAASVGLSLDFANQGDSDATLSTNLLEWAVGELGTKNFTVNIVNDDEVEENELFAVVLDNPDNVTISGSTRVTITIRDDDSNQAPTVSTETAINVNTRSTITLMATASDPEAQDLTYSWVQTSGTAVTLANADSLSTTFTTPDADSTLRFTFTATDDFNASTSIDVTVNVIAPEPPPGLIVETPPSSSSGGAIGLFNLLVLLTLFRRTSLNRANQRKS
ncbi:MAG: choice-of-anchor B domain-containing protein [Glaciecola sp.]|jgi:choice-of-anchor B domain-containing protein